MSAAARIVGFAVVLAAVFAAAAFAGARLDPGVDDDPASHEEGMETTNGHGTDTEEGVATASATPPGLASAQDGYRVVPDETALGSGPATSYRFRIVDQAGQTVHEFDLEHERRMHLIVIRRDFADFQHLHPRQLEDGSWEVEVDLSVGGVYRAFADFATGGSSLTLATDLFVAGRFDPVPLPPPASSYDAGDGYEVSLDALAPRGGGARPVRFTVTRKGRELDSVEPYLGADGYLVALREHDQAFLHTHPQGEPGGPGPIAFQVEYPSAGRYRLFLQFKHEGEVRTAAFTQVVSGPAASDEGAGHGGH